MRIALAPQRASLSLHLRSCSCKDPDEQVMSIALAPPQASPPLQLRSCSRQDPDEQVKGVGIMTQFGKGVREVVIRPLRISFIERQLLALNTALQAHAYGQARAILCD